MKFKSFKVNKLYLFSHAKKVLLDNLDIIGYTLEYEKSLNLTMGWIEESFNSTKDGGSSAGYIFSSGWKSSYPETTGYLIPTLIKYFNLTNEANWKDLAINAADWLLSIQDKTGGWQGLQVDEKCETRVFNTAMIIEGLKEIYKLNNNEAYFNSIQTATNWIIGTIENNLFIKNNVVGGGAFDSLVCYCLLLDKSKYNLTKESELKVLSVLDSICSLQQENFSFKRCCFEMDEKMLLHHLGYTLDGLLLSSKISGENKYYETAFDTCSKLLSLFEVNKYLPALLNSDWTYYKDLGNKSSQCLTGNSQIAICFMRIYQYQGDLRFLNAALKLIDIVTSISNYKSNNRGISYGVAGSYPINGIYHQYQFVNWGAKYHVDSILLANSILKKLGK